jgi:uncharacterized cupin superfamily protein
MIKGEPRAGENITYPGHGRVCHRDRSLLDDIWLNGAGKLASSRTSILLAQLPCQATNQFAD